MTERLLLLLLLLWFCVPGTVTLGRVYWLRQGWPVHPWLSNATLGGFQQSFGPVPMTLPDLSSGLWQENVTWRFNHGFAGREALIRCTGEAHFRVFRTSPTFSSGVLVGRQDTLFERDYLREFFLERRLDEAATRELVAFLSRLRDACRRRGAAFMLIVTPSKAATYPELAPPGYRRDPRPRGYDLLKPLLLEAGIPLVDGPELARRERLRHVWPAPLFPRGGIHWGRWLSFLTAQEAAEAMRRQGLPHPRLSLQDVRVEREPRLPDNDLELLLNLARKWEYPVVVGQQVDTPSEDWGLNLACVGGSFCWQLMDVLNRGRHFTELDCYFYTTDSMRCYTAGGDREVRPVSVGDLRRRLFSADCVILEINESLIHRPAHLRKLMSLLRGCGDEVQAFPYASYEACDWGEVVSFRSQDRHIGVQALQGFSHLEPFGAWTDGPVAAIRLQLPEGDRSARLELHLGGYVSQETPSQTVRLLASGRELGRAEFTPERSNGFFAFDVPREAVSYDGRVTVELHPQFLSGRPLAAVKNPTPGGDPRALGVWVGGLRVTPTASPEAWRTPVSWGRPLEVGAPEPGILRGSLEGFSGFENGFTWTAAPRARVHLQLPERRPVWLEASVGALVHPRWPVNRAHVLANGRPVQTWSFQDGGTRTERLLVPEEAIGERGELTLTFDFPRTVSPRELGVSPDPRPLALRLHSLKLTPVKE
ncbi:MAG: hypothetical protein AB1758_18640 [Candidatus Eremiobacterota bacterium]